jgi:hypothetical protein
MYTVFVDPIDSKSCWRSTYEESKLVSEQLSRSIDEKNDASTQIICYDAFRIFKYSRNFPFCKDIKIFYEIMGYKFESFIDLARQILGKDESSKYLQLSQRVNAHIRSFQAANYTISKYSVSDLIPNDLLVQLYNEKARLALLLYQQADSKAMNEFYEKFFQAMKELYLLGQQPIYVDMALLEKEQNHFFDIIKKDLKNDHITLDFQPVGAKTGRISFKKGTTNLYILPTDLRRVLIAPTDYKIIQADFKSFQPRIAIFSTEDEAFKKKFADVEDIYSVFPGDRDKNKISFLAWLFSNHHNPTFEEFARPIKKLRSDLYELATQDGVLLNKFDRPMFPRDGEEEHVVFQNYITSNEADAILGLTVYLSNFLKGKKSRLVFPFHDSLVFYIHKDEHFLIDEIKNVMENYHRNVFGVGLPVKIKQGNNFLEIE